MVKMSIAVNSKHSIEPNLLYIDTCFACFAVHEAVDSAGVWFSSSEVLCAVGCSDLSFVFVGAGFRLVFDVEYPLLPLNNHVF